uniref:Uncharacterized protein n=1 Tax=Arundo donax TaxID=35708 RepID=A0A0A9A778_ARUDO
MIVLCCNSFRKVKAICRSLLTTYLSNYYHKSKIEYGVSSSVHVVHSILTFSAL